jgi:hypothetical protein
MLYAADSIPTIAGDLVVQPREIVIHHQRRPQSILVMGQTADGLSIDLSGTAAFTSADESVARVDLLGWVHPVATGTTNITISAADKTASIAVKVDLPTAEPPYSFTHEVMPVLSKGGCNMGACHGYSLGKNGFKLSLRGAEPEKDFASLTEEFFGRRLNRHNPPASLILAKPLGDVPHKGGLRFDHGSLSHQLLLNWIAGGATSDLGDPAKLETVEVFPKQVVLAPGGQHQLQLLAHYSDGTVRDVTKLGIFTVNTERIASVDDEGLVTTLELGETAVVARFERMFTAANFIVLQPNPDFRPTPVPQPGLIDRFVIEKLNHLRIKPSELAGDEAFLRRVYVDLIGIQPTPDEILAFTADADPDKRTKTIDRLFAREEFIDKWSLKWGDLLQNTRSKVSTPAMFAFREWIRSAIASNMPLDEFAREVLTSRGGMYEHPASAYYAVSSDADETLQRVTQVFCGVRMLCARCHPHPFENWTQADYYGLHSFFNQVTVKTDLRQPKGTQNAKAVMINLTAGNSRNPRSGQLQPPRYLGGGEPELDANVDRRVAYAEWLTAPENPHFAPSMVNRIWSYFFHRGIIDPVDDLRTTNPPINPELLDALVKDFVAHQFDMRHLMRTIVTSETYQRTEVPNASNEHDNMNFSRMVPRRLPAESMLDCLVQATNVPENFGGMPAGFSATQLPDATVNSEFLSLFGKPQRMEACECERDDGSNMLQALHFINGKSILSRVTDGRCRVNTLLRETMSDEELIERLYLWTLARRPSTEEIASGIKYIKSYEDKRNEAAQDLMWALLNSKDFMLLH